MIKAISYTCWRKAEIASSTKLVIDYASSMTPMTTDVAVLTIDSMIFC